MRQMSKHVWSFHKNAKLQFPFHIYEAIELLKYRLGVSPIGKLAFNIGGVVIRPFSLASTTEALLCMTTLCQRLVFSLPSKYNE